jgi:hypothetical protein
VGRESSVVPHGESSEFEESRPFGRAELELCPGVSQFVQGRQPRRPGVGGPRQAEVDLAGFVREVEPAVAVAGSGVVVDVISIVNT